MSPRLRPRSAATRLQAILDGHSRPATNEERDLEGLAATLATIAGEPIPPPQRSGEARARMLAAVAEGAAERRSGRRAFARGTTLAAATIAGVGMLVAGAASPGSPVARLRDSIGALPAAIAGSAEPPPAAPIAGQEPRNGTPAPTPTSTPAPEETPPVPATASLADDRPAPEEQAAFTADQRPSSDSRPSAPVPIGDDAAGAAPNQPTNSADIDPRPSPTPTPARPTLAPTNAATPTPTRTPGNATVSDIDSADVPPPPTRTPTPLPTRTPATNADGPTADANAIATATPTPTPTATSAPGDSPKLAPATSNDDGGR